GLVAEAYEWDKEKVSSDDNEMVEVKVLMALADDEIVNVTDSSVTDYDSAKESSSLYSTPLLLLEKLAGVEPVLDTIPSLLKKVTKALNRPPKTTHQLEGEQVKKDKGKKALSHEEGKEEESKSDLIEEEIKNQKKIEQTVKVDVAKDEVKQGKE
nr:hypothetical protein [Tanacetum cinerariifolium]